MDKNQWEWKLGEVDTSRRFFELKYGYDPAPVARINLGENKIFIVQFILPAHIKTEQYREILKEIIYEVELYLINNSEPDPFSYMIKHTLKCANIYSRVHWRYYPSGSKRPINLTKESRIKNFGVSFANIFSKFKIEN